MLITILAVTVLFVMQGLIEGNKWSVGNPISKYYHTYRFVVTGVVFLLFWCLPQLFLLQAVLLLIAGDRLYTRVMCIRLFGSFFANIKDTFSITFFKWQLNMKNLPAWLDCALIVACYAFLIGTSL